MRLGLSLHVSSTILQGGGAKVNLLPKSQAFDDASWDKVNVAVTPNVLAPDGTMTAERVIATAASGYHYFDRAMSTSANTHTVSIYAKAAGLSWFFIEVVTNLSAGVGVDTWFNASTGEVGTTGANITARSVDVGGGYYRFSVTYPARNNADTVYFLLSSGNGTTTFLGDGITGIDFWGAQGERGDTATNYIPNL